VHARLDVEPGLVIFFRKYDVFDSSLSRRSVVEEMRSRTWMADLTITGGSVFEKRYGRERCRRISMISLCEEVKPPLAPPSALPSVLVMMSTRPITPQCSCVPLPCLPMNPVAWLSSTITRASYFSARSQIPASLATSRPSRRPRPWRPPEPAVPGLLEPGLEIGHVVVQEAEPLRLGEPDPIDDRGVVELLGDDRVLLLEQRLEQAPVGVEARGVEDRVVQAEEAGDLLLQLAMDVLGAADEADGGHAVAALVEALAAASITAAWLDRPR